MKATFAALLLVAACGGSAVEHELGATPIIVDNGGNKLYASAVDSVYTVTPPVSGTQCPAGPWTVQVASNCYYIVLGGFTDTYQFNVPADSVYSFEATGNYWHYCVAAGRAHPCYTESMTITEAVVQDASGNTVLVLDLTSSTPEDPTDWTGSAQLPAGDYSFLISGFVSGNRPGVYGYSVAAGL